VCIDWTSKKKEKKEEEEKDGKKVARCDGTNDGIYPSVGGVSNNNNGLQ
jgi:hypothetical protein